jgi:hypothetical protein
MYYWDSYWTIKGLLVSKMTQTVKGTASIFYFDVCGLKSLLLLNLLQWHGGTTDI